MNTPLPKLSLESEIVGRQLFFEQYPAVAERWRVADECIRSIQHLDSEHFLAEFLLATYRHRLVIETDDDYADLVLSRLDPLDLRRDMFSYSVEGRDVILRVRKAIQFIVWFEVELHGITT